jgi:hypothetical protein
VATLTLTQALTAALQYLGVLDAGETPATQMLTDALPAMNNLLDNWSSEQVMIPGLLLQVFNLVSGTQSYAIGSGQTFNVAQPMAIIAAELLNTMNAISFATPVEVVNALKWGQIADRNQSNSIVKYLFYDRSRSATAKVSLSPVPLGGTLELTMWVPLTQFADATTPITITPGYFRVIELGLAIEIAPQYDVTPSQTLMQNYADALARVRNLNAELVGSEPAAGQVLASSTPAGNIPADQGAQGR